MFNHFKPRPWPAFCSFSLDDGSCIPRSLFSYEHCRHFFSLALLLLVFSQAVEAGLVSEQRLQTLAEVPFFESPGKRVTGRAPTLLRARATFDRRRDPSWGGYGPREYSDKRLFKAADIEKLKELMPQLTEQEVSLVSQDDRSGGLQLPTVYLSEAQMKDLRLFFIDEEADLFPFSGSRLVILTSPHGRTLALVDIFFPAKDDSSVRLSPSAREALRVFPEDSFVIERVDAVLYHPLPEVSMDEEAALVPVDSEASIDAVALEVYLRATIEELQAFSDERQNQRPSLKERFIKNMQWAMKQWDSILPAFSAGSSCLQ